jgi:DNA polymerase III epsilon subunit-like protein
MARHRAESMQHWNGCRMVVIDTETTGLDAHFNELIQICIVPLDANINILKEVNGEPISPFYINLIPDHPERFSREAQNVNKIKLSKIAQSGFDRIKGIDLLMDWFDKLDLPCNKMGKRLPVIPLGQNYGFDRDFIIAWLGMDLYFELFHWCYRDTMVIANYLNDHAAYHVRKVPYSKTSLNWICKQHGISNEGAHDALIDCVRTAAAYKKMLEIGLF